MKLNKYENMEIKNILDEDCLFDELLEKVENMEDWEHISLIAKADLVEYITKNFISINDFSIGYIDLRNLTENLEYILTITKNKEVFCEPARKYIDGDIIAVNFDFESDTIYIYQEDVKQDIIDSLLNDNCEVTLFGFGEETDEKLHGFTISNSDEDGIDTYSFYCTDHDVMLQELKRYRETKQTR